MKIKKVLSQHRNDFTAVMVCEHCNHEQKDMCGYMDANYIELVIPRMFCGGCGLNRSGEKQAEA